MAALLSVERQLTTFIALSPTSFVETRAATYERTLRPSAPSVNA